MSRAADSMRPTLASVAKACEVFSTTVSRVLCGDSNHRFSASLQVTQRIM